MVNNEQYIELLKSWNLDDLVDHVMNTHHAYLKANYPLIIKLTEKILAKLPQDEKLVQVYEMFKEFTDDLARHLIKEEEILFPYFRQLGESKNNATTPDKPTFGALPKPIEVMEEEHDDCHDILDKIKDLTNNFTAPKNADPSVHFLYFKLKEFDEDMHTHHELENNIIFPKASQIEQELS